MTTPPKRDYKHHKNFLVDKNMKKYSYDDLDERTCKSSLLLEEKNTF